MLWYVFVLVCFCHIDSVAATPLNAAEAACEGNKCLNGATYKQLTNGDICLCPRGFWGKYCESEKTPGRDLAFVIGHSANKNSTEWQLMLDFVDHIISNIHISQSSTRIALVTYSTESRVIWKLNDDKDIASYKQILNQLQDTPGPMDVPGALALLHNEIYTPEGGDRPDVRNEVAFLIDGVGNGGQNRIEEEAEACHLAGIDVYAVAIGKRVNKNQLNAIGVDELHRDRIDSFDHLDAFAEIIASIFNRQDKNI